jgi:HK97 gp10 family phage protein
MSIVIIGLPEAMAKIAAIPAVAEAAGEVGLTAGKVLVAGVARTRAPKLTGRMASQIVPVPEGVAALEDYSRFVDQGTRYMAAQPFLGEALEDTQDTVSDLVGNAAKTALYAL